MNLCVDAPMSSPAPQSNPHEAYRWFVDELASLARSDVTANRIRRHGHGERTNDMPLDAVELERRELFLRLPSNERELLAGMFEHCRERAIHDVAAFLEGLLSCDGMRMERGGQEIPASPYNTMHADLLGRIENESWPDD